MSKLDSQIEFLVDPEAEPTDLNEALARFLLTFVRQGDSDSEEPSDHVEG